MGFGGRLAHRSCLCMGENEPILYVMASRRGEKKNIAFFFVFLGRADETRKKTLLFLCFSRYIRGKQKKGVQKSKRWVTLS